MQNLFDIFKMFKHYIFRIKNFFNLNIDGKIEFIIHKLTQYYSGS